MGGFIGQWFGVEGVGPAVDRVFYRSVRDGRERSGVELKIEIPSTWYLERLAVLRPGKRDLVIRMTWDNIHDSLFSNF